jgi:hypothetical protein
MVTGPATGLMRKPRQVDRRRRREGPGVATTVALLRRSMGGDQDMTNYVADDLAEIARRMREIMRDEGRVDKDALKPEEPVTMPAPPKPAEEYVNFNYGIYQ